MSAFVQAYPWLTFWLVVITLVVLDNMVANLSRRNRK